MTVTPSGAIKEETSNFDPASDYLEVNKINCTASDYLEVNKIKLYSLRLSRGQ